MRNSGLRIAVLFCSALLFVGCSLESDWRTVPLKGASLQLMLPCKPQSQTRAVELGQGSVAMTVVGCEAGGSTFAVTHFLLADPTRAGEVLDYWQKAVLAQLPSGVAAAAEKLKVDTQWLPKEALNLPQSRHIAFTGMSSQKQHLIGNGLWFANMEGSAAHLYHVVIYGVKPDPKDAEMFFSNLKLK